MYCFMLYNYRHEQSERHEESVKNVKKASVLMLNTENNKSIEEKLYPLLLSRISSAQQWIHLF